MHRGLFRNSVFSSTPIQYPTGLGRLTVPTTDQHGRK